MGTQPQSLSQGSYTLALDVPNATHHSLVHLSSIIDAWERNHNRFLKAPILCHLTDRMQHVTHLSTCQVSSIRGNATTNPDSINQQASTIHATFVIFTEGGARKSDNVTAVPFSPPDSYTQVANFRPSSQSWQHGFHSLISVYNRRPWMVIFTLQPPYPWSKQWHPLSGRMCGPLNRSNV